MVQKYFGGTLPEQHETQPIDQSLIDLAMQTAQAVEENMENLLFSNALSEIWKLVSRANKYIDETMPWALAKDPQTGRALPPCCTTCANRCALWAF